MRPRRSAIVLTLGAAAALLAFVVIPVIAQIGGTDVLVFSTDADDNAAFTRGTDTQDVGTTKGCQLKLTPTANLVTITGTSSNSKGGVAGYNDGIGVKSGSSNGTPCGQTEQADAEILTIASRVGAWDAMILDLELKQNALIEIKVSGPSGTEIFAVLTGSSQAATYTDTDGNTSEVTAADSSSVPYEASADSLNRFTNCANPSDSGPDSGPNDNCRLTIMPSITFTQVTFRAIVGSVSLEGGEDFIGAGITPVDDWAFDSVFFYAVPPTALDDEYTLDEDNSAVPATTSAFVVPAVGVLANDSDSLGLSLTAVVASSPAHGTLNLNSDGGFSYTPNQDFNGTDSFQYRAVNSQGTTSGVATVTLNVTPVNDPPAFDGEAPSTFTGTEDTTLTICPGPAPTAPADDTIYLGAGDVDSSILIIDVLSGDGYFSDSTTSSGCVEYRNEDDFNTDGSDPVAFTYQVCDDLDACTAPVPSTLTVEGVNDAPVANDDPDGFPSVAAFDVDQNKTIDPSSVPIPLATLLSNDTDIDGDSLSVISVGSATHGSVSIVGSDAVYTPTLDDSETAYSGPASFEYTLSDGTTTTTGTVHLEIFEVQCFDELREDTDGDVYGGFTLLTSGICKRYAVDADAAAETVTFTPEGDEPASFYGELRFPNAYSLTLNSLALLEYDPGDGTFVTMPICLVSDPTGLEWWQILPGFASTDTPPSLGAWCLLEVVASADAGDLRPLYKVYGIGDPIFKIG